MLAGSTLHSDFGSMVGADLLGVSDNATGSTFGT